MRISVNNASYRYPRSDSPTLRDISFSVTSGNLTAILGPNGSGKTTLLRCLMGFLKWSSGSSDIDGTNIRTMPPKKLWELISYVPQAKNVNPAFTVEETVLLGRAGRGSAVSVSGAWGSPSEKDREAAIDAITRLRISGIANRRCGEISGGELQMALIARALAAEPKAIILDEPESNLDFRNQLIILDAMSSLAESGLAVIFNTHYPAHALQRANRSLMLSKDGTALFGPTDEIINEDNIASAFGVEAEINEIRTGDRILRTVIPLNIIGDR